MMKQKNQNWNRLKTFLLWVGKEKWPTTDLFFSFYSLGLPFILTLLSLVLVATFVVTLWPVTVIGLCWCECLAKWHSIWSLSDCFLYFLEHNSFCFGRFLVFSPDNVSSTRFQSNMNQQHKKKCQCDACLFRLSFSGNSQLSIQTINPLFWHLLLLH